MLTFTDLVLSCAVGAAVCCVNLCKSNLKVYINAVLYLAGAHFVQLGEEDYGSPLACDIV